MSEIRPIKNINLYGMEFYYDPEKELVGFPTFYNEDTNALDYRVGHQFWMEESQAKAIVLRILQLKLTEEEMEARLGL